ncbi:DUF5412 family protein [Bacillus infantis]|uniref:DUF5412 family protein n=1 Tax=Bacillus infantis TaxID=324767 RepID=UPI003CFB02CD
MNLMLSGFLALVAAAILLVILCAKIINPFVKKKRFPNKFLIAALAGAILVSSIYVYETYFFTFSKIDRDNVQMGPGSLTSPYKEFTAAAFYEPYGGAAGGVNVWVEVTNNHKKTNVQTVYYADAKSDFSMKWIDEDTLYILNDDPDYPNSNRSIKLKIGREIYHENGLACKSLLMKDEFETCYQN